MSNNDIIFLEKPAQSGLIGEITLNRPKALNALTLDMCQRFYEQLMAWDTNDDIRAVILKAIGDRAFCAGGDIRRLYEHRTENPKKLSTFFFHEYRLNLLIHHFSKPYFSLLHQLTMGGGAGISIHGRYRIATENFIFAMPETKIGFFPDIGANYFLNQCPDYTGLYLGLTGNIIDGATAKALNLVTHCVSQNKIAALEKTLYEADNLSEALLTPFTNTSKASHLLEHIKTINICFSKDSVSDIIKSLEQNNDWAKNIAQQLKFRCPTSLSVTYEAYHRAKQMNIDNILQMDFDIAQQFLQEPDFFEGVRAAIIEKDQSPNWQPEPSNKKLQKYFEFKGAELNIGSRGKCP